MSSNLDRLGLYLNVDIMAFLYGPFLRLVGIGIVARLGVNNNVQSSLETRMREGVRDHRWS